MLGVSSGGHTRTHPRAVRTWGAHRVRRSHNSASQEWGGPVYGGGDALWPVLAGRVVGRLPPWASDQADGHQRNRVAGRGAPGARGEGGPPGEGSSEVCSPGETHRLQRPGRFCLPCCRGGGDRHRGRRAGMLPNVPQRPGGPSTEDPAPRPRPGATSPAACSDSLPLRELLGAVRRQLGRVTQARWWGSWERRRENIPECAIPLTQGKAGGGSGVRHCGKRFCFDLKIKALPGDLNLGF